MNILTILAIYAVSLSFFVFGLIFVITAKRRFALNRELVKNYPFLKEYKYYESPYSMLCRSLSQAGQILEKIQSDITDPDINLIAITINFINYKYRTINYIPTKLTTDEFSRLTEIIEKQEWVRDELAFLRSNNISKTQYDYIYSIILYHNLMMKQMLGSQSCKEPNK